MTSTVHSITRSTKLQQRLPPIAGHLNMGPAGQCDWCRERRSYQPSDEGNAKLLADVWGSYRTGVDDAHAVYCVDEGNWYLRTITDAIYRPASRKGVARAAAVLLGRHHKYVLSDWEETSEDPSRALRAVRQAETHSAIHVRRAELDTFPTAFVDQWGDLFDLETGSEAINEHGGLVDSAPARMLLTRKADVAFADEDDYDVYYDPATVRSELWETFLEEVLPDPEVREYVRLWMGYCATGLTREEKMLLLYGPTGQNGKGVLLETVQAVLGDYAGSLQSSSLLNRGRGARTFDLAAVSGKRMVTLTEPPRGAKAATHLLKAVTGGDTLQLEHKFGTPFADRATYKLIIATNYLPALRDRAMWRRVVVVPFDVRIPDDRVDPHLKGKLRQPEELVGVGGWLLRAARDYLRAGSLPEPPSAVAKVTRRYQLQDDPVTAFLADRTTDDPEAFTLNDALWTAFQDWAQDQGVSIETWTKRKLGQALSAAGYATDRRRVDGVRQYGRARVRLSQGGE